MAKAGLLFVGTGDGLVLYSNPNNIGRWLKIGQPFREKAVRAVWPLADNPLVVFAAVDQLGLQRSEDGGQSWQPALDAETNAILGARSAPQRLYAATAQNQLCRSDDGGTTWVACAQGGWSASPGLHFAPGEADTIYLGDRDGSIWYSPDAGSSWTTFGSRLGDPVAGLAELQAKPAQLFASAGGRAYTIGQASSQQLPDLPAPAAGAIAALSGKVPALLLALADGAIARSDDAGASWAVAASESPAGEALSAIVPASYHVDYAFAGGGAGQLLSTTDRGRSWQVVKQDLPPIYSIAAARLI